MRILRCGHAPVTWSRAGVILLAYLLGAPAHADTVGYVLTPMLDAGRLRVELTWDTQGRTQSALTASAQWGTVADVPALIRDLRFTGVAQVKPNKTRWLLEHTRGATLTCRYEVDPGRRDLTWEAMHYPIANRSFFHGIGNTFLLIPQAGGGLPEEYDITLRWQLPEGWTAVCSWGPGPHVGARLAPLDLRHSVYLAGKLVTHTQQSDGHSITVAMLDRFGFDAQEFARLAGTIVAHECRFMEEKDFPPFVVTAVPVGEPVKTGDTRVAGMGLHHSFALFAAPKSTLTDAFENLFAHELFHYWNGGVLRAQQPLKLVYWFVEGLTDYYAWRILYEAGYWQPTEYAKWINRQLREYARNPAAHARNDEIDARFYQERDTIGAVAYQRGLLLALRWHRLARDRGVSDGIDKLFKTLVQRGRRPGFELSNEGIRRAGLELLGDWFGSEFDKYVMQAETVEVPTNALAPGLVGRLTPTYDYELGFDKDKSLRELRVRGLVSGSEAAKAALREADELVGWKIRGEADEKVELQVLRGGKTRTIRYYPRGQRRDVLQFEPAEPARRKDP